MTEFQFFLVISIILVIIAGVIYFKNFKNLRKSLYWLAFPNIISIWSKKRWDKDFENAFRFEKFIVLAAALVGINFLIFKYLI